MIQEISKVSNVFADLEGNLTELEGRLTATEENIQGISKEKFHFLFLQTMIRVLVWTSTNACVYNCKYVNQKPSLPSWPLNSQQVSHQRWIWGSHKEESTRGIHTGFETQGRHQQKSTTGKCQKNLPFSFSANNRQIFSSFLFHIQVYRWQMLNEMQELQLWRKTVVEVVRMVTRFS